MINTARFVLEYVGHYFDVIEQKCHFRILHSLAAANNFQKLFGYQIKMNLWNEEYLQVEQQQSPHLTGFLFVGSFISVFC